MPVVTRSQTRAAAASGRGLSATNPTSYAQSQTNACGNEARGANKNRASTRDRGKKNTGALQTVIPKEGEESNCDVPRTRATSKSRSFPFGNDSNKRGVAQPQATVQPISLVHNSGFDFTIQHAGTSDSGILGPSSSRDGAGKNRKDRGTTAKCDTSKTKNCREHQQKKATSTGIAPAGAKRQREEEDESGETGGGELISGTAPHTRTLRRVRRKTWKAIEAENQMRDVPAEKAAVGSKRRNEAYAGDVEQTPLDPGPSRRTIRCTRQNPAVPGVEELERKTARNTRSRRTIVMRRPATRQKTKKGRKADEPPEASLVSTPERRKSEEPTIAPIRLSATLTFKAEKSPTPREEAPQTAGQGESTLPPILHHASMEQVGYKRECSEEPSLTMPPQLPTPVATVTGAASQVEAMKNDYTSDSGERAGATPKSRMEGNGISSNNGTALVKEESISPSSLNRESLSSLSDSDKENVPSEVNPLEFWLQKSPQFAVLASRVTNSPEERANERQDNYEYSVLQPRRPLETLSIRPELAPGHQESEESERPSSREGDVEDKHDEDDDDRTPDRSVSTVESISPLSLRMRWISELCREDFGDDGDDH